MPNSSSPKLLAGCERQALSVEAQARPRLRAHRSLHPAPDDPVQRMLVAIEPGTYVRPHRHRPQVWELFTGLVGRALVLLFADDGAMLKRVELGPGDVVEIPPRAWHSLASLAAGTVVLEVKPGPYQPVEDKDFAAWAPPEGDAAAPALVAWFEGAVAGDTPHA